MNESGPLRGNRGKCPTIRAFFLLLSSFFFLFFVCMDEREIFHDLFIYFFLSFSLGIAINEVLLTIVDAEFAG